MYDYDTTSEVSVVPEQDSTLAYRVFAAFNKLRATNSSSTNAISVLSAWSKAYPSSANGPTVLEIIGHQSRALRHLESQIASTTKLRPAAKKSTAEVVTGLRVLVRHDVLPQGFIHHQEALSDFKLGMLESAGVGLALEFPETHISNEEAARFHSEIKELSAEIQSSDLSPELKTSLGEYLSSIFWAIENRDTLDSATVRDCAAAAVMSVMEASARTEQEPESENRTERISLLRKIGKLAGRIAVSVWRVDATGHRTFNLVHDLGTALISSAS